MNVDDIKTVVVVGAGTMGAGIAGEFARAGCSVRLVDTSEPFLDRGMQMLCLAQESLIEAGLISSREGEAARKRVALHSSLTDACDGMQLLVETVTEDLNVKKAVLEATDRLCPRRAIFASNTSGLCQ